jgi:hypothetical protein
MISIRQCLPERFKQAFTTRRVDFERGTRLLDGAGIKPNAGDVVLAEVTKLGQHTGLQAPDGRRASLFKGDLVAVAYGNRYATDQFEAHVPEDLRPCDLVAAGGIAGREVARHTKMSEPTQLRPLGLLTDCTGQRMNLADFRLPDALPTGATPTIAVLGTQMNSGKTTAATNMIRGLVTAGYRVGAAKVTGTGASADVSSFRDAGACQVLDFTDAGFATTYKAALADLKGGARLLLGHLEESGAEVIVLEVADGLYQSETAALVGDPEFRALIDIVLFAACDGLSAVQGVEVLSRHGLVAAAVTGLFTASALAIREVEMNCLASVVHTACLLEPECAAGLLPRPSAKQVSADAALPPPPLTQQAGA